MENEEFGGVFYFTNPTNVERTCLWNNKEYTFEPESRTPLIIPSETLENIQEIRKRFAKKIALERLYEGEVTKSGFDYKKAKEMGNGLPPTFDEKILEPFIEECLKPLPLKRATVKQAAALDDDSNYKATKSMGKSDNPVDLFREENNNIPALGEMPE